MIEPSDYDLSSLPDVVFNYIKDLESALDDANITQPVFQKDGELTQEQWIVERLRKNGKITRNECLRNYISRLGARISDLKAKGWVFETSSVKTKTRFAEWGDDGAMTKLLEKFDG